MSLFKDMYVGEVYSPMEQKTFTMYVDTVDGVAAWKAMVKVKAQNGNLGTGPSFAARPARREINPDILGPATMVDGIPFYFIPQDIPPFESWPQNRR
jgi:hypothetical protein